jgi:hypothetical protein
MTFGQLAHTFHRIADALDMLPASVTFAPGDPPGLEGEHAIGAALIISYLRDLFTVARKDLFRREDILVILDEIRGDPEIMTPNLVQALDNLVQAEVL